MSLPFELLVIAVLLLLNGVFAAYEIALSSVTHARLLGLERAGIGGATAAVWMKTRIERSLAISQVGMTLTAAITAAFGGASVEERFSPFLELQLGISPRFSDAIALAAVVIPLSALTIVFAELAPKVLAIRHPERVACVLSPPMRALASVLAPVVTLLEGAARGIVNLVTRARSPGGASGRDETSLHELTAAAAMARTSKLIGAREERIVRSAALLSSRALGEIELPAADISLLPIDLSLEQALLRAHLDMHTRFPVARVDGDPQSIDGYVTFKDLIGLLKMSDGTPTLRAGTRPIHRIRRTLTIAAALDRMVRERTHIALVVDDADHVTGMVTLEDIIEELVGDIEDEFDRLPAYVQPTGDGFIIGGGITLDALAQRTGIVLPLPAGTLAAAPAATTSTTATPGAAPSSASTSDAPRVHTLADWVQRELDRPPHGGEMVSRPGVVLLVRKLRRKKLAEAFLRKTIAKSAG